jgi:hypothetical protein
MTRMQLEALIFGELKKRFWRLQKARLGQCVACIVVIAWGWRDAVWIATTATLSQLLSMSSLANKCACWDSMLETRCE